MGQDDRRPALTRAQVREIDRIAIEELGIPSVVLMENAGRGAAEELLAALDGGLLRPPGGARPAALVLCGGGNNAGDGYVVARHLANAGLDARLAETAPPEKLSPDAAVFRRVTVAMGLAHRGVADAAAWASEAAWLGEASLLVDAVLGTGFHGEVREPLAGLLSVAGAWAREGRRPVVALDVPSGLDVDTGDPSNVVLRADLTLTFAAAKVGLERAEARAFTGPVRVVSIGAPPGLVERVRAKG
jgi:NAD(P)H-hydrate epimerase